MRGVAMGVLAMALLTAAAPVVGAGPDRVSPLLKSVGGTNVSVRWSYPAALQQAFQSAGSEDARTSLGIAELRKQAAAGDRASAFELGYFHLFGIGMTQNLAEAEVRLGAGPDLGRPEGLYWLAEAWAGSFGAPRDLSKAGEFVHRALSAGYTKAIPLGLWIAQWRERPAVAWIGRPAPGESRPAPALAERILRGVLRLEPGHADALLELAGLRLDAKDPREAWALATRVLGLPDVPAKTRALARLLRVATAQKAGRVAELGMQDVREIAAVFPRRTMRIAGIAAAAVGSVLVLGALALWVVLTRRRGGRGPGWFLTGGWIGLHALIFGFGILHPVGAAITGTLLAAAIVLSVAPASRQRLFPPLRRPSAGGMGRNLLAVAGGLALIFASNAAYQEVYARVAGHPPDLQLVAAFLRADNTPDRLLLLFAVAVCIPIVEETAFRGFLTDWLHRRLAPWGAVVVAAGIFGSIHGFTAAFPVAVIGLVCGWLRLRSGGLWLPIVMHGLINAMAVFML